MNAKRTEQQKNAPGKTAEAARESTKKGARAFCRHGKETKNDRECNRLAPLRADALPVLRVLRCALVHTGLRAPGRIRSSIHGRVYVMELRDQNQRLPHGARCGECMAGAAAAAVLTEGRRMQAAAADRVGIESGCESAGLARRSPRSGVGVGGGSRCGGSDGLARPAPRASCPAGRPALVSAPSRGGEVARREAFDGAAASQNASTGSVRTRTLSRSSCTNGGSYTSTSI